MGAIWAPYIHGQAGETNALWLLFNLFPSGSSTGMPVGSLPREVTGLKSAVWVVARLSRRGIGQKSERARNACRLRDCAAPLVLGWSSTGAAMVFSSHDTLEPQDIAFLRIVLEEVCEEKSISLDHPDALQIAVIS
jgi:hypothetical protein